MKKQLKFYDVMEKLFGVILIIQFLVVTYINLTQLDKHLGYDATAYYLKAMECWKQKTLFCNHWVEQTTLFLDSPMPLAIILYGILGNIFVAYGIANTFFICVCMGVFALIGKQLDFDRLSIFVCLNLYLCPHLTTNFDNGNDLEYFSSALTSNQGYGVKPLIVLMIILAVLQIRKHDAKKVYLFITALLCFVAGISSGYYILAVGIVPCIMYFIIKTFIENDWKEIWNKTIGFLLICAGLIVSGKWIAVHLIGFAAKDSTMIWVGLVDFWKNLGSIFIGFGSLVAALPGESNVEILLPDGRRYIFSLIIILIIVTAIIYVIRTSIIKKRDWNIILIVVIIGFQIVLYALLYSTYGSPIFEVRYLIVMYYGSIILIGYMLSYIDRGMIFSKFGLILLLISIAYIDITSDQIFINNTIDEEQVREILDTISETDAKLIWYQGNTERVFARNLRVLDPTRIYKVIGATGDLVHWGDYTYYDSNEQYTGPTVLLTESDQDFIPEYIMTKYEKIKTVKGIDIYLSTMNPYDMVSGISGENYSMDLPVNFEIGYENAYMENDGTLVTNGAEGTVMWNENCNAKPGNYDVTLYYDCIAVPDEVGFAEFGIICGDEVIESEKLQRQTSSITVKNVQFDDTQDKFTYYLNEDYGTVLKIRAIEIKSME